MCLSVNDIEPVLRGADPDFEAAVGFADFYDGGDVLGGERHVVVFEIDCREAPGFYVIDLKSLRGAHPESAVAVFECGEYQIAGEGTAVFRKRLYAVHLHSVEEGEAVLGGDPDESLAVLVDVIDLAARKAFLRGVQTGCLGVRERRNGQ